MAEELLLFGIQKLWDLLSQEYTQFKGVEDQVTELRTDLNRLKSFLKDADVKKQKNTTVRNCVEEIKEIIYDAEDVLETFILKDQLRRTGGIKKRIRRFASIFADSRKFASDIGGISQRISKVITNMQSFGVVQQIFLGRSEYSLPLQESLREMRKEFAGECETDLVGLEANVEKLVGYLVEEDDVQVVSVIGMGGLGKTTLARQAFNHNKVKSKFDRFAWVCVTQEFNRKSVWQTILKNFKTKEEEDKIMQMEEDTLQVKIFKLLETTKSLIVIDDIWEQEHWDRIRKIFPTKKGWKVLLTSRNTSVAVYGNTLIRFEPQYLTNQDSWTLFQKIAFPRKDAPELEIDERLKKMGKQMVEGCGGLPLAIRVLGGLLAAKYTPHDWERISDNIGSHIVGGGTDFGKTTSLNHVLSLSFEELPSYLKSCFLYLAHFPEDYEIEVEKLSYYWAAEGILKPRHNDRENIRDVGESYLEDQRRELPTFSRYPLTNYNTLSVFNYISKIRVTNSTTLLVKRDINNPNVRSLVIVLKNALLQEWKLSSLSFTRLQLLRVLHIPGARLKGKKLSCSIGELIHLRYFSIEHARVHNIPSSLGNLKLLIYLNINVAFYNKKTFVPNVLMGMKDLRYLALPRLMHRKTKLELSNLVQLETLINFSVGKSKLEDLHGMSRLRNLEIGLRGERSLETLYASIGGLRHLENLDIRYCGAKRMQEEDGTVMDFNKLKKFKLVIIGLCSDELRFPSRLTILSLWQCSLEKDPMPILEKLLHLKEVCVGSKSFSGKRIVCSTGGFLQLQKLELSGLEKWEEWIVEEGSMNLLHTLTIRRCEKLKELPDGLRFVTSVQHLEIRSEGEEWKERLSERGEDYYKVQHIPFVKTQVVRKQRS